MRRLSSRAPRRMRLGIATTFNATTSLYARRALLPPPPPPHSPAPRGVCYNFIRDDLSPVDAFDLCTVERSPSGLRSRARDRLGGVYLFYQQRGRLSGRVGRNNKKDRQGPTLSFSDPRVRWSRFTMGPMTCCNCALAARTAYCPRLRVNSSVRSHSRWKHWAVLREGPTSESAPRSARFFLPYRPSLSRQENSGPNALAGSRARRTGDARLFRCEPIDRVVTGAAAHCYG